MNEKPQGKTEADDQRPRKSVVKLFLFIVMLPLIQCDKQAPAEATVLPAEPMVLGEVLNAYSGNAAEAQTKFKGKRLRLTGRVIAVIEKGVPKGHVQVRVADLSEIPDSELVLGLVTATFNASEKNALKECEASAKQQNNHYQITFEGTVQKGEVEEDDDGAFTTVEIGDCRLVSGNVYSTANPAQSTSNNASRTTTQTPRQPSQVHDFESKIVSNFIVDGVHVVAVNVGGTGTLRLENIVPGSSAAHVQLQVQFIQGGGSSFGMTVGRGNPEEKTWPNEIRSVKIERVKRAAR